MKAIIQLLRPKHYIKNGLLFLPSVLAGNLFYDLRWLHLLVGFLAFSMMASVGYILNDIVDIDKDRKHPIKKNRPLAAAIIKSRDAFFLAIVLFIVSIVTSLFIGVEPTIILFLYFLFNYGYSIYFKQKRFLDIIILSGFYLVRIYYGALITDTILTEWFIVTITFVCLALSLNKRYMELSISKNEFIMGRDYSKADLQGLLIASFACLAMSLLCLNIHAYFILQIRSPLVMGFLNLLLFYAILKMMLPKIKNDDQVELILKDKSILLIGLVVLIIYSYFIWNQPYVKIP